MKNQYYTYIGFGIALIAALGGVLYPQYAELAWGLAGLFGFSSIAVLRNFISSKGWKTYVVGGITALAGILSAFGVIDSDVYRAWLAIAAILGGITVQQALSKEKITKSEKGG
jgi:hypothetical protein